MQTTELAQPNKSMLPPIQIPEGMVNLGEISKMLIEQMKEVKNNPAAIPQAECAAMVAGRIVDIAKTQVAQMSAVNDLIRTKNGLS
ncbi:hypothetical protein [Dyadobacter sp. LHD-138]|uniref:hypothetical protein n=1 Tax=Dyadobacter sp. LHD-138 TaxID=3071413 RepID=UPI0027DFE4D6|nr:hypothetical protein [Dyadobacter sp. LHD-138]MDQ6477831.1 hypothetical protein [Dyadobacter sp. LHD-138]